MWPALERALRYVSAGYIDLRLYVTGKGDPELPPLRLRDVGHGDFRALGQHLLTLSVTYGLASPGSHILDIGCGVGRLALPLASFLTNGDYEGFDVSRRSIRWCRRNISRDHPNFHFSHVRLKNPQYTFRGGDAARFVFPYENARFDCVVAYSVFTHLNFAEIRNYLQQTYRVLAPRGRFVATYFLLNDETRSARGAGILQFPHERDSVWLASAVRPAFAVALEQDVLTNLYAEVGFRDVVVERGGWCGRPQAATFQDLIVCRA